MTSGKNPSFEGVVIARKHGNEPGGSFTVRKLSGGIAVEKYTQYIPYFKKIEIVSRTKIKRAKLYHLKKTTRSSKRLVWIQEQTWKQLLKIKITNKILRFLSEYFI